MSNTQPILIYLLIFLALSIVLKLFGVIEVSGSELLGYAFIFYGITMVYISFSKNQPAVLFFGSSFFLTGLLLFLISNFEFSNDYELIFPALLLILGINFLMLYFHNSAQRKFLAISLTAILSAVVVIILIGTITFENFFLSVQNIALKYWPIVLIAAGLLILLSFEFKRK